MIVAIPYVKGAADFDALKSALLKMGPQPGHILITLNSDDPEEMGECTNFTHAINHLFDRGFSRNVACDKTAYGVANSLVAAAIRFASNYQPGPGEILQPPLLILDPSYVPTTEAWASQLQSEYFRNGASVLGVTENIPDVTVPVGKTTMQIPGGAVFIGPVIMRQDFGKSATMLPFLRSEESWRATLRWDMLKSHAVTKLISHLDSTAVLTQQGAPSPAKRQRRASTADAGDNADETTADTPTSPRNPFSRR